MPEFYDDRDEWERREWRPGRDYGYEGRGDRSAFTQEGSYYSGHAQNRSLRGRGRQPDQSRRGGWSTENVEDDGYGKNVLDYLGDWMTPGPFSGVGPRGYRRSDERILEDIHERLTQHGRLDATDINVRVNDGEVTLQGSVFDRRSKRIAEDIANSVRGVVDIHNLIQVNAQQRDWSRGEDQLDWQNDAGESRLSQRRRS